ncbi:hypothetical protein ACFSHT_10235 [Paraburkholderia silviterrae]|uniref:Uncharacterized protein n=1 Tax=Paraburkholderia silviterrae TaxID=2528715 RepID=A0A4R5ME08_9BURK|nr:hypothetical protein [Paraburkholderia silviterrae]TDG25336.1 hypothetical protein EYW47_05725 [Paraburkholderia silviterrae]
MKRVWQCVEVAFALAGLGVVVAFLVYAFKLHSEAASGWVQAVGSIAAIFGAYKIGERQSESNMRQAQEMAERERRHRMGAYGAVVEGAHNQAKNVIRLGSTLEKAGFYRTWNGQNEPLFNGMVLAIDNIPLHDLGSPENVRALILMKSVLAQMGDETNKFFKSGNWLDEAVPQFRGELLRIEMVLDQTWAVLEKGLIQSNAPIRGEPMS